MLIDDMLSVLLTLFLIGNVLLFFRLSPPESCSVDTEGHIGKIEVQVALF